MSFSLGSSFHLAFIYPLILRNWGSIRVMCVAILNPTCSAGLITGAPRNLLALLSDPAFYDKVVDGSEVVLSVGSRLRAHGSPILSPCGDLYIIPGEKEIAAFYSSPWQSKALCNQHSVGVLLPTQLPDCHFQSQSLMGIG